MKARISYAAPMKKQPEWRLLKSLTAQFFLLKTSFRACALVFVVSAPIMGINTDYISDNICDSVDCSGIIKSLKDNIETVMPDFPLVFITHGKRDSISKALQGNMDSLCNTRNPIALKQSLFESLLLLYQSELGKNTASAQAFKILSTAAARFPQSPEIPWMRGLHYISSGKAFDGIKIMDSLYVSGFDEKEFLGDYTKSVFHAFIPPKSDTSPLLLRSMERAGGADTAPVFSFSWKIIRSHRATIPFFDYDAGFAFRKQFRLVFSGMTSCIYPRAMLDFGKTKPQSSISVNLTNKLYDRMDSSWCSIHIDVNDTGVSLFEYLLKRINGIYDSIGTKTDLPQYNGISLRCYNRNFWGGEGTCTAYIVFDRYYYDLLKKKPLLKKNVNRDVYRRIRFTVTMRSGLDVIDQAEAKLQSIIKAF